MMQQILSRFQYPFPMLKNSHAEYMQYVTDTQWIDGEFLWIYENDPVTREQYKKTKTAHMVSQWFPTVNLERLRALCRFMLWTLYNDDMCEEITPAEIKVIQERSIAVLKGELTSAEAGIPLGGMLGSLRRDLLPYVSAQTFERYVTQLDIYFKGLMQEVIHKQKNTYPSLEECIRIREESLCLSPFLELTELETGITLPPEILDHPVMKELRRIATRMLVYFNEVQSVMKDEATNSIYYNVVKVIQFHQKISLEDACHEQLRIHDLELKEFIRLQSSLPDFGEYQDAAVNYVHYISLVLSGWKAVSSRLARYNSINGFPSAETARNSLRNTVLTS